MNRQKKLQQLFKAKAKKASAKLAPKSKDRYISKAERERLAAEAAEAPSPSPEAKLSSRSTPLAAAHRQRKTAAGARPRRCR